MKENITWYKLVKTEIFIKYKQSEIIVFVSVSLAINVFLWFNKIHLKIP